VWGQEGYLVLDGECLGMGSMQAYIWDIRGG
jgi:hypothetical protein